MNHIETWIRQRDPASFSKCWIMFIMIISGPFAFVHLFLEMHWFFVLMSYALGWYTWTFAEYMVHRFSFHKRDTKKYQQSNHFRHHVEPTMIFLRLYKKLLLLVLAIVLTLLIYVNPLFSFPAGFFLGFAFFNYLHRWLHQPWAARFLPSLQKFHMQHHCGKVHSCFGVTCTWWDELFDTCAEESLVGEKARRFYFIRKERKRKMMIQQGVSI
jgi:hypothetical protein